jgi:hypothetical protein
MTIDALNDAIRQMQQLKSDLTVLAKQDPNHDVKGLAVVVMDRVLNAAQRLLPPDAPAASAVREFISAQAIAEGRLRAADAQIVVGQLLNELLSARGPIQGRW